MFTSLLMYICRCTELILHYMLSLTPSYLETPIHRLSITSFYNIIDSSTWKNGCILSQSVQAMPDCTCIFLPFDKAEASCQSFRNNHNRMTSATVSHHPAKTIDHHEQQCNLQRHQSINQPRTRFPLPSRYQIPHAGITSRHGHVLDLMLMRYRVISQNPAICDDEASWL